MARKKVLFIMNPKSGTMQASKMLSDIMQRFSESKFMTTMLMTSARGDATRFAEEYSKDYDMVVVSGGDGTLNETIDGILNAGVDVPIGYIPSGSTNDFAASLGLPKTIVEAAEKVCNGKPTKLDIGSFNGRHFSYVASFGAFTSTSYSVPQNLKNIFGHAAYILSGIKDIVNIHPIHAKITADPGTDHERVVEGDYLFGGICNSRSIAGIVQLSRDEVDMNDGLMEALLIPMPNDLFEVNDIIAGMTASNLEAMGAIFFSAESFEVEIQNGTHWTLDGEYEKGAEKINIETMKSAITIIC